MTEVNCGPWDVEVIQDGGDFYMEFPSGRSIVITAPVKINSDYDVVGAREARTWFKDYCVKNGLNAIYT